MGKERDTYSKYRKDKILNKISPWHRKSTRDKDLNSKYSRKSDAPMHIALIIDGMVEDVMHCDERLAMLLMSEPKVVEIDSDSPVTINWLYDEEKETFYEE